MQAPDDPWPELRIDETVTRAQVPPRRPHRQGGHEEAAQVELLGHGVRDVLPHHRGREGQEGHARQLRERQPHQAAAEASGSA